jgi:nitrogen regulatory protein PII 2
MGCSSMSIQSVEGRGKQKGDVCREIDPEMPDTFCTAVKLTPTPSTYAMEHSLPKVALFVPKRMVTMIVPDDQVEGVVKAIVQVNKSGRRGDGKIFVSQVEAALRVRTGETGTDAVK